RVAPGAKDAASGTSSGLTRSFGSGGPAAHAGPPTSAMLIATPSLKRIPMPLPLRLRLPAQHTSENGAARGRLHPRRRSLSTREALSLPASRQGKDFPCQAWLCEAPLSSIG